MADIKFTNFAQSTLATGITDEDTTIAVEPGQGARFPAITVVGDFFYLTLENASLDREIVKVTARLEDAMTVVRAQDETISYAWNAGDPVALRLNAAGIEHMFNQVVRADPFSGSALVPQGDTAGRGVTPAGGSLRFNTDTQQFEGYDIDGWGRIGGDGTAAETAARLAADEATAASADAAAALLAAAAAQDAAEIAAASINIPNSLAGESSNFLRVKVDETGYELVSSVARPTFFGFTLSADGTELLHTYGSDDYNASEYTTWAVGDGVSFSVVNNNLVVNL
tara:strand:- start:269 stop:1117 length:849 start_codon:yes stop_codon:yes gene_type:complete